MLTLEECGHVVIRDELGIYLELLVTHCEVCDEIVTMREYPDGSGGVATDYKSLKGTL